MFQKCKCSWRESLSRAESLPAIWLQWGKHIKAACTGAQFQWVLGATGKYWGKPFILMNIKSRFHSFVHSANTYWTPTLSKSLVLECELAKNAATVQWKKNRKNYMKVNIKWRLHLNTDKTLSSENKMTREAYSWFSPSLSLVGSQTIGLFV